MVSVRSLIMTSASLSSSPYEDLKAKLVSSYTLTRWQRVAKVFHHPALGDRHPTTMMDSMLALLPKDEVPGSLLLGLFLERLPVEMRDHLVAQDFKNPSDLALHTDKLWDAQRVQPVDPLLATATFSSTSAEAHPLFVGVRLQVLLVPRNVIFTEDLVLMLITAVLHAVFRETPEPMGGGGIKQPLPHLSTGCFNESSVPGGYRSFSICFS